MLSVVSAIALWVLVLAIAFLLLGTLRALGRLGWRLDQLEATTPSRLGRSGLRPGVKAPDFTLPDVAGKDVALSDYSGERVLLVFTQIDCSPCLQISPSGRELLIGGTGR